MGILIGQGFLIVDDDGNKRLEEGTEGGPTSAGRAAQEKRVAWTITC